VEEPPAATEPTRVCLCLMVRDESAVLERCLDAAAPIVDALCLCDTGSRDDTVERAEGWLAGRGLPGRVFRHEWRDFGANRTLALEAARSLVFELGWDPDRTYLLFLDADMVLSVGDSFHKEALEADVYRVLQRNVGAVYPNVRLARASLPARYVGATHEYYETPAGATSADLPELSIDDLNDGGCRADKLERDARLLEAELAENPANARAMFYLAQTFRGLRDFGRALFWYRRRIAAGGWPEEVWYSHYAIGLMQLEVGDARAAVRSMHQALRLDPGRVEPWFRLALFFRNRERFGRASFYARRGLDSPPQPRMLFPEDRVHPEGLRRELQIAAYSTRWRELGFEAGEALALGEGVTPALSELAARNQAFYALPLPAVEHVRIEPVLPPELVPANPSVLPEDGGYLVNCRAVSYRIDAGLRFVSADPRGLYRTENYLLHFDRELRAFRQEQVEHEVPPAREAVVRGLEDCRLVAFRGRTLLLGTTWDLHPLAHLRMALFVLDGARAERFVPLHGYGDERVQKNWLPFVEPRDGELHAIYGYAPLVVLRIDVRSGRCEPVVEVDHGRNLARWRGSAGPLRLPDELGGGWLVLVHEVVWLGRRYYFHRFAHYDEDWRLRRVSRPFYFRERHIEFSCGMCAAQDCAAQDCAAQDSRHLVVAFSVMDREAWLAKLELERVIAELRPV
jgi:glycosyltransferase involved in cell wall biosynthesis